MEKYLYEQNIHWQNQNYDSGIRRELLDKFKALCDIDQVIAISGIRQCGKSFLLKQLINYLLYNGIHPDNILFTNLELPAFAGEQTSKILDTVLQTYRKIKDPKGKIFLFLDEIQTIPNWETWLKYNYDQNKGKLKIFITGSNSQLLSSEFATKLSGRIIEKQLYPFSFTEMLSFYGVSFENEQKIILNKEKILHYFDQYLNYGSMPETLHTESLEIRRELLSSYFNTIIYKDIVPRFSVRDSHLIQNLALYLLGNSTSLLNLKKIADSLHSHRNTIRDYVYYLEQAFMSFIIPKFNYSHKVQLLSQKKSYSIDNGFISLLAFRFSVNQGKLLENIVFLELKHRYNWIYYYKNLKECDFIVYEHLKDKLAVQVCYSLTDENIKRELKGLKNGCDKIKAREGYILNYDKEDEVKYEGIKVHIIPVWKWMLNLK